MFDTELRSLCRPRQSLSSLVAAVKEIEEIPAYLPSGVALKDAVQKAKDWLQEVEALQVRKLHRPCSAPSCVVWCFRIALK